MTLHQVRWERGPDGRLRGWIRSGGDRVQLRQCADVLQDRFAGEARDRVFGGDLAFWDFMVGGVLVTVHLDRGVGIALLANDTKLESEALLHELAEHLARESAV
jgi:hypothetical protein